MPSLKDLIAHLKQSGVLKTQSVTEAFETIDRKNFILPEYDEEAYEDHPLPIGFGQTISQPYTVAFMLELLGPRKDEKILDVGAGSGWTTALLSHIVGEKGAVYGVELVPELVTFGQNNITKYHLKNARIIGAQETLGLKEEAPFDKILVSAGDNAVPQELVEQLKVGGVMVIPVQGGIWKVTRSTEKDTEIEKHEGFLFVRLLRGT